MGGNQIVSRGKYFLTKIPPRTGVWPKICRARFPPLYFLIVGCIAQKSILKAMSNLVTNVVNNLKVAFSSNKIKQKTITVISAESISFGGI